MEFVGTRADRPRLAGYRSAMTSQPTTPAVAFNLAEARTILERTPATLDAMLRGLSPTWTDARDGADTWSTHEILAHLINADRTDWIPRAEVMLARDPSAPFPPFDRTGFFDEARSMSVAEL